MKEMIFKKRLLQDIKRLKAPEGYLWAGIPKFMGLFGRDSLIVSWQLLEVFPEITRDTLQILAKFQGKKVNHRQEEEPGRILHEYYPKYSKGWFVKEGLRKDLGEFPHYGSVDSTLWFLIVSNFYYQKTKDAVFIKKIWPNLIQALEWIENYGDKDDDGFVEYQRMNHNGPHARDPLYGWNPHQGWKECLSLDIKQPVAIVEAQGYTYLAYKSLANFSLEVLARNDCDFLREKAKKLKINFNQKFWMEKEKFFALGLDGNKNQIKDITSNPGHLLFTGIIDDKKVPFVVKRLFKKDMWTPFGIRTLSVENYQFRHLPTHPKESENIFPSLGAIWPHDNWIIYKGLQFCGYYDEAERIKQALILAYNKLGCIPEFYDEKDGKIVPISTACCPQAWATGGLFEMVQEKIKKGVIK